MIFIVEYTNEELTGNQVLTLQIEAEDMEDAWNTVEANYPYLAVDSIYPEEDGYEYDGQPDEYTEWMDFDPDC